MMLHAEMRYFKVAFRNWKTNVATDRQRRVTLARFEAKWKNQHVFVILAAWTKAASEWKRERVLLARCAMKIQKRSQRSMMDGWIDFVAWRDHARVLLGKILKRLLNSALGRYFHHWLADLTKAKLLAGAVEADARDHQEDAKNGRGQPLEVSRRRHARHAHAAVLRVRLAPLADAPPQAQAQGDRRGGEPEPNVGVSCRSSCRSNAAVEASVESCPAAAAAAARGLKY